MTTLSLTKTRFQEGVWEGILTDESQSGHQPEIRATHLDRRIDEVEVIPQEQAWVVRVHVPKAALSDGVQTILIVDAMSDTVLNNLTFVAGDPLQDDIRAEVDLLRAELDMLKRAFRRHCLETT